MAADHVRRHASRAGIQHQATDLLQAAALAENTVLSGGRAAVPPELLGELVAITGALAGRRWLRANAASPAVGAFTTLCAMKETPALPALDQILSALLWRRFSGLGVASGASGTATGHHSASRLAHFGSRRHRTTA
jgi:hypothetical protein